MMKSASAATPYGVAVTIALHDLSYLTTVLQVDIRRGHFENVAENLKTLHDGVRGLRTELDLRSESTWGRQLTTIRAEISEALQSEIESVSGRVPSYSASAPRQGYFDRQQGGCHRG